MIVWSRKQFNWIELTPAEVDELAAYGDEVAEGLITEEEAIDRILSRREERNTKEAFTEPGA